MPTDHPPPADGTTRTFAAVGRSEFLATITQSATPPATGGPPYRFGAGNVLARRYLIVAPLGRGGMGEVYRADDLALVASVALKFLPASVSGDPASLARFRREVATARQVSHPHVCRVYDIGESDGQAFLSMEYIPGDDLARLLRRAGRLAPELAIDLARQVAAGLQAVHDEGLVHRDLKPANVMVDGRGRARITDFGLAATAASVVGVEAYAGTPAYQAPEQLTGGAITERTDVYALGVLAYELLTGRRPFATTDRKELIRLQQTEKPAPPSSFDPTIPPEVDRIVLKCLHPDPMSRPASASEVWRALPGDAALNAALAAGQTPSAVVVADAGGEGRLSRRTAVLLAAAALLCTTVVALLHKQTSLLERTPHLPREELSAKAAEIVAGFEHNPGPHTASDYYFDVDFLGWQRENDRGMNRLDGLAAGRPLGVYYWYRVSDSPIIPRSNEFGVSLVRPTEPPFGLPGSALVRIDPTGRLVSLHRVPRGERKAATDRPDTDRLFALAGLDPAAFRAVEPSRNWAIPYDRRYAWAGVYPERPDIPLTVEAATDRGEVVAFRLVAPWTAPESDPDELERASRSNLYRFLFYLVFPAVMLTVGGALTVRHVRAGRADLRGAGLLALVDAGIFLADLTLWAVFRPPAQSAYAWVVETLMKVLLFAGMLTLAYLAFEPFVRRRWPWQLVGWTRLLAGRWRDPLVGRDILTGALVGSAVMAVFSVTIVMPGWLGLTPESPVPRVYFGSPFGALTAGLLRGLTIGLILTFVTFLTSRLLRTGWLWVPVLIGLLTLATHDPRLHQWLYTALMLLCSVASAWVLCRRGLLAFVAGYAVGFWHLACQLTFDFDTEYWPSTAASLAAIVLVVGYGLVVSVGGWRRLVRAETVAGR